MFVRAINPDILIEFMGRLTQSEPRKIVPLLDDLWMHNSKPVKQWLVAHD
jgi:hypothetical protein